MKQVILAAVLAATVSVASHAQPPAPNGQPPVAPRAGQAPPPPPVPGQGPAPAALVPVNSYSGTVAKLVSNDDFVYDGFYLLSGKDSLLVKFPPHLGNQVVGVVKQGASVSVKGAANTNPDGITEIRMVSLSAGGKTIADTASAAPLTPPTENSVSGSGKIASLQKDREGRINGFILSNNTLLRLPPEAATQLGTAVQNGAEVAYTGMQKAANNGEATAASYKVVHCRTITVNGQQYML